MGRWYRIMAAAAAALGLGCAAPEGALASDTQETIVQDDTSLIYASPTKVAHALVALKTLGVDRIRMSVVWSLVAPHAKSSRRPKFDATNPNAYPRGVWNRYDTVVRLAYSYGIKVYFQLTAPAPNWATTPLPIPQGYRWSHEPNAKDFGQFVQAVGRRYAGIVNYWGIWNEPNIGGWMTPQWRKVHGTWVEAAAAMYRPMVDAAWRALRRTGHGHDTILIGETAAAYGFPWKGFGADMSPLVLLRALYCLGSTYRPLRGARATAIGCPASGNAAAFARAHPGLFDATGWAHHPYDFAHDPAYHIPNAGAADLADLSRIERALDRTMAAFHKPAGMALCLTEWGYQSNPPDPFVKFSAAQQAEYLNEGEYMAWRDPRVRAFGQFLLIDEKPMRQYHRGSHAYWSSFQSGLIQLDGKIKPSFFAFQIPIWLPSPRHGSSVAVWGQLRPASHSQPASAEIEFRGAGSGSWSTVGVDQTTNPEGFFLTHVALPSAGVVRIAWPNPATNTVDYSRSAQVS